MQNVKKAASDSSDRVFAMLCCDIIAVTVVGRLIAGVRRFTDTLGGILISISILSITVIQKLTDFWK